MSIRALLDRGHPRAPDLDRVGTWLGTDRPLLLRGALKGRVVLLDFWTSGCVNCLHALPVLRAVEERFRGQPFQVVGIHSGKFDAEKEVPAVAEAMARHGIEHPVGTDSDFVLWEQYAIHGWPTSVLVDARGYAVAWFRGEPELGQLTAWIQAALDDGRERGALAQGPPEFQRPATPDTGPLAFPGKVLALGGGGLAVADSGHHRVLVLDGTGRLVRAIGWGLEGFADGPPDTAAFRYPQGLAERAGMLYVADTGNHAVRRVDLATGRVETVAGTGQKAEGALHPAADARTAALRSPWDVVFVGDTLWIAMAGAHQLWRLDVTTGALSPGAGSGREGLDDGPLAEATFAQPSGLATDGRVLYVADSEASALRRVDPGAGTVKTLAGEGLFEFGLKDGALGKARFQHPLGLALAGPVLWVADTFNGAVRRVSLGGRTGVHRGARARTARGSHPLRGASRRRRHRPPSPRGRGPGDGHALAAGARRRRPAVRAGNGGAPGAVHAGLAAPARRGCGGCIDGRSAGAGGASPAGPHLHRRRAPAGRALHRRPVRRRSSWRPPATCSARQRPGFPSGNALRRHVLGGALLLPGRARLGVSGRPAAPAQSPGPHRRGSGQGNSALPTHTAPAPVPEGPPGGQSSASSAVRG